MRREGEKDGAGQYQRRTVGGVKVGAPSGEASVNLDGSGSGRSSSGSSGLEWPTGPGLRVTRA